MDEPRTIRMDAAGRVVIPASIREELALVGGAELVVDVQGGEIHLRPASTGALARRGRRLVVTSALTGAVPDHRTLRDERTDRLGGR